MGGNNIFGKPKKMTASEGLHIWIKLILFILSIHILLISCSDSQSPDEIIPANLVIEITNPNDGSGFVYVQAFADNATRYDFYFGEAEEATPIQSEAGVASYTYNDSGEYLIEVLAYGDSQNLISSSEDVHVIKTEKAWGWIPETGYSTPISYAGWELSWQDEFAGETLDESYWNYEIGTGSRGWGNNELQFYRAENTMVKGGYLFIEAREENYAGSPYTSSRLTTAGKYYLRYGRVDIRASLPKGQGLWPALWMLGSNIGDIGWPACGEIDIMEMVGGGEGRDDVTHGTLHWENNGYRHYGGGWQLESGILYDEFHVYSLEWDQYSIKWLLDDIQYFEVDITPESLSEFQQFFFFIFNVAVGGNWPGYPNESTEFPQRMIVDYIRTFEKSN